MMKAIAIPGALLVLSPGAAGFARDDAQRGVRAGAAIPEESGPIGLRATLNHGDPVYAVGDQLGLTIVTARAAAIEVWELDASGALNKILPARGTTLLTEPGKPLKLPRPGMNFQIGPPIGVTELHIIAKAMAPASRSIDSADLRLAGRGNREDVKLRYTIVQP